ncbi:hypothetical protein SAMN05428969_0765 [Devosia sp. YR412]|uniref:hypothetical protein n=1 Tax=Devosia sp. YR412 TaxID=1881030 RepID=UPI0008AC0B62|nr:hypothetical protein [Devosia sp. YR412]SEP75545.1 hypothetical protein SAMN05428969_0765 [Devosia sp. YR412]
MNRTAKGIVAAIFLCTSLPAIAADYPEYPELRPAYQQDWERADDDIGFEFGTAYWYSWGGRNSGPTGGASTFALRDTSSIADIHGRIDDLYTNTYLLARAGISLNTTGTYTLPAGGEGGIAPQSLIGYSSIDYGWLPLGSLKEGHAFGGLIGYQYWKENPYTPGVNTDMDIQALRLGLRATAQFEQFDLQSELVAVPYAYVRGGLTNRAYGVMSETMAGFRPTENLSLRFGGRAWYLENSNGTNTSNLFRYGLMAEVAGRF